VIIKLLITQVLFILIESITLKNMVKSYISATLIGFFQFMCMTLFNNWSFRAQCLFTKIQSSIIFLVYKKTLSFNKNAISNNNIGKIINIISSDFNNI
jgi:hypothetical protein